MLLRGTFLNGDIMEHKLYVGNPPHGIDGRHGQDIGRRDARIERKALA